MLLSTFSSDTPSIEDIDAKIESLNHDITLMHAEILRLKEYRNTRMPTISKLPPEVLTIVFESIEKGGYISFRACDHLLAPTQVCRAWRRLALSLPHIWARIDASAPPDLVELFLERAGSAPISLQSSDLEEDDGDTLDVTLDHLDRLKEITLRNVSSKWVQRITSEPAPQLEILTLQNRSSVGWLAVPFAADAGAFPALRHLSLTGYVFDASPATLANLRSLKINTASRPSLGTAHYTNPVGFFASLDGLPFLSSLDLIGAFAPLSGPIPPLSVSLPNLTHLAIEDANLSNLGMMSCIRAPLIRTIKLLHTGQADASAVAAVMPAIYANLRLPDIPDSNSTFALTTTHEGALRYDARVRVWARCAVEDREKVAPFFELKLCAIPSLEDAGLVFSLCPSTTLPPSLHFNSTSASHYGRLSDIPRGRTFSQLKNVGELCCDVLSDVVLALCDDDSNQGSQAPSLPSVKQIALGSLGASYRLKVLYRLKKELCARKAAGVGIEILRIRSGALKPEDVEELKDVIDVVEVPLSRERFY